jgi:hypothetical protein
MLLDAPCPPRVSHEDDHRRRLSTLREAVGQSRRAWRSLYGRFWQLRHENSIRRPSWRVEEETKTWHQARAEVRRYAELRGQLRDLGRALPPANAVALAAA